jgi:hypothetical protein
VNADVIEMVRDKDGSVMHVHDSVKIMENEKSGKPETIAPERIGDPGVKVIVVGRWSVV